MAMVHLHGVDRPGLPAALAARGLAVSDGGWAAVIVAADPPAASGAAAPARPLLVVATGEARAASLLDAGVDDVVDTSASDALIAARAAALARRGDAALLHVGDLVIDTARREVTRDGRQIALLPREYRLLLHLARQPGRAVTRQVLLEQVWHLPFDPGTNVVEVQISRLRAKLHRGFAAPLLLTERGRGYRLEAGG